jgi:hypothetical protein
MVAIFNPESFAWPWYQLHFSLSERYRSVSTAMTMRFCLAMNEFKILRSITYRGSFCTIFSSITFGPYSRFSPLLSPSKGQTDERVIVKPYGPDFHKILHKLDAAEGKCGNISLTLTICALSLTTLSRLPGTTRVQDHFGNAFPL